MDKLTVKCYSGHTYAERPVSFVWQGVEYEVEKIEREWMAPKGKCFIVIIADNRRFQLCYNEAIKEWSIIT